MPSGDAIPLRELSVELCQAGGFDRALAGILHSKTCPYTIFAQGMQGHYEIACGDGRHEVLAPGEAFLTGANQALRITHHGDPLEGFRMRVRWLHLHVTLFGVVDATALLVMPLRVDRRRCAPFASIIAALLDLGDDRADSFAALARRSELGFRAFRQLCDLAPLREDAPELLRQRHRLGPVLELMRTRLAHTISVADLARQASLSVSQFHVFFRSFTGRTPMDYLKHLRLSEACRLLATGDEPLRTIAERTGFCDEYHLGREFRRTFGTPPGRWRNRYDRAMG